MVVKEPLMEVRYVQLKCNQSTVLATVPFSRNRFVSLQPRGQVAYYPLLPGHVDELRLSLHDERGRRLNFSEFCQVVLHFRPKQKC